MLHIYCYRKVHCFLLDEFSILLYNKFILHARWGLSGTKSICCRDLTFQGDLKMHDYVGQQFGNYRLIRLVGRGGFADVYLGEHKQLNTYAAIKVLHTHMTNADIEKFRMEACTIARLVHPIKRPILIAGNVL